MSNDTEKRIARASYLLMGSILLSRIIGLAREWALVQTIGATAMTDVYYASFTIPDFLNHLMAVGALSISFIPMLSRYIATGKEDFGKRVFQALSTYIGLILVGLVVLAEIFAEDVCLIIAPGFTPEKMDLLIDLVRIILPAQIFFFWGGLAISVQHTYGRFFLPALAPILYNLGIILFGVLFHKTMGVRGFSVGVLVGSALSHGMLQAWGVFRLGYSFKPLFALTPELKQAFKRYLWITFPIMFGFSLVVADEWITKFFASYLQDRALSWLAYARTEMRIPVALLGQAAGIASFPYLSRLWSEEKYLEYGNTLLRELQKLWAAAPLAALIVYEFALPITHSIYGGGRFHTEDFANTALALKMFSLGIAFWAIQLVLSRGFYAAERTWFPSILGTGISFLIVPIYWALGRTIGFQGLALAGSIGIAFYCFCLSVFLRRHLKHHSPQLDLRSFYQFVFCWLGIILLGRVLAHGIQSLGIYHHTQLSAITEVLVGVLIIGGMGYFAQRKIFVRFTKTPLF